MRKSKFYLYHYLLVIPLFIGFWGCQKSSNGGTTTGNPLTLNFTSSSKNKTIAMKSFLDKMLFVLMPTVNALPPPNILVDAHDLNVNLSQFWVVIKEIEFKESERADSSEVDGSEVSLPGPYTVNLFSTSPAKIGNSEIHSAGIRRIKMKLSKLDTATTDPGIPSALSGQSIYIAGTVNNNLFTFTSSEETSFEVAGAKEIPTANVNSNLLVSINIANLIRKIDLSSIANGTQINETNKIVSTNPCPLIDTSAQDIYSCFRLGLKSESNLGKDSNNSGELESDEESVH